MPECVLKLFLILFHSLESYMIDFKDTYLQLKKNRIWQEVSKLAFASFCLESDPLLNKYL